VPTRQHDHRNAFPARQLHLELIEADIKTLAGEIVALLREVTA